MEYEIGQIFEGNYTPEVAEWCNNNNAYIKEIEEINGIRRFQITAVPEPTIDELKENCRVIRDRYLYLYVDPIICNPFRWEALSTSEQDEYKNYRLYLLNYPQSEGEWYKINPLTFTEWKEEQEDDD